MVECLAYVIKNYNNSGNERAFMQEYDANAKKAFILCIITLMCRIQRILQAGKPCYMDAYALFEPQLHFCIRAVQQAYFHLEY
jgi:hypothetical protein